MSYKLHLSDAISWADKYDTEEYILIAEARLKHWLKKIAIKQVKMF